MKKIIVSACSLFLVLTMITACGSNDGAYDVATDSKASADAGYDPNDADEMMVEGEAGQTVSEPVLADGLTENTSDMDPDQGNDLVKNDEELSQLVDNRKYIRSFRYYIETLDYTKTEQALYHLVDLYFGYFETTQKSGSSIYNQGDLQEGSYSIRIPKEKVDEFVKGVEGLGNVVDSGSFVEDVTSRYYDTEARIDTLEIQEERLLNILKEANNLEYIIELERELSDVRYKIESYESTFRNLKDSINYATIQLELYQVREETKVEEIPVTFLDQLGKTFSDSIENLVDFFKNLTIFLLGNSPLFIFLFIIGLMIHKIIKKWFKKDKKVYLDKKKDKDKGKKEENRNDSSSDPSNK